MDTVKVNRLKKLRKETDARMISGVDYIARLQHAKLNPGTEWARINRKTIHVGASDDESDDESGASTRLSMKGA